MTLFIENHMLNFISWYQSSVSVQRMIDFFYVEWCPEIRIFILAYLITSIFRYLWRQSLLGGVLWISALIIIIYRTTLYYIWLKTLIEIRKPLELDLRIFFLIAEIGIDNLYRIIFATQVHISLIVNRVESDPWSPEIELVSSWNSKMH